MKHVGDETLSSLERARVALESWINARDFQPAIRFVEENLANLTGKGISESEILWYLAARVYSGAMKLPEALRMARQAEVSLSRLGETIVLAQTYITLGVILRDMGELDEAERSLRDAESIFRRSDHIEGQADALNKLAQLAFMRSDMTQAVSLLTEAIELARVENNTRRLAYLYGNLGRVQSFLGKSREALKNLSLNVNLSEKMGDKTEVARSRLSLGYERLRMGALAEAGAEFSKSKVLIEELSLWNEEVIYHLYEGELRTRRGEFDFARESLTYAFRLAERRAQGSDLAGRARRQLAELAIEEKDFRRALRHARSSELIFEKLDEKIDLGALCRVQAQALAGLNRPGEAISKIERSLEILDESNAQFELAVALEWAGNCGLFSPHKSLAYLFRAQEKFARRGDNVSRERIERAVEKLPGFTSEGRGASSASKRSNSKSSVQFENPDLVAASSEMRRIVSQLEMIRGCDLPVLLTGETGVGKGILAKHFHSAARPDGPFVSINITNVPETLLESELFGHAKGAYTDAFEKFQGVLVSANGGTLFLDEIGEMPLTLQMRLLTVIEEKRFRPLGSTKEVAVDFTLITATNCDLKRLVEQGEFRRDLYHRLDGFTFNIPPLRERKQDIPRLLELFLRRYDLLGENEKPEAELIHHCLTHPWPGNVRELENLVKRMKALSSLVREGSLIELVRSTFENEREIRDETLSDQVSRFEKRLIEEALIAADWNKSRAARLLKVNESTLRAKMRRFSVSWDQNGSSRRGRMAG